MNCCKNVPEDAVVVQKPSKIQAVSEKDTPSHPPQTRTSSREMYIEDFPGPPINVRSSILKDSSMRWSSSSRKLTDEKRNSQDTFLKGSMISSAGTNPQFSSFRSLAGLVLSDSEEYDELDQVLDMLKEDESYKKIADFCEEAKEELNKSWGISAVKPFNLSSREPLTVYKLDNTSDGVIVMEGWNKVLAFKNMFAEALIARWRIDCAIENLTDYKKTLSLRSSLNSKIRSRKTALVPTTLKRMYSTSSSRSDLEGQSVNSRAHRNVERNLDPVALAFGERTPDLQVIIISMLDMAVREICPHAQIVQREAYRSCIGSMDPDRNVAQVFSTNCSTFEKICALLASYGLEPRYWVAFCETFLWAMKTHNPYTQPHEADELEKPKGDGAFGKFIAGMVGLPLLEATLRYNASLRSTYIVNLKTVICQDRMKDLLDLGSSLFENLFRNYPEMSDYFVQSDVDEICANMMEILCAIILESEKLSEPSSSVREKLIAHSKTWQQLEIPKDCFSLIGIELVDLVSPIFAESFSPDEAERMEVALGFVFKEAQKFIIQPLLNQENTFNEARRFYEDVAKELNWTSQVFEDRLFEVNRELSMSGTYTQTSKEIEIGARLCWRNSAKCIGRIAWNTLEVRDRRHCTNPNDMIKEIVEHLKLATGGTNIQSVMTVFRPQFRNELWGLRFWSSQFVRYAGYIDEKTGEILGDPANAKFTSFLIDSDLWSPPYTKTVFDILPIVIKLPNNDTPFVVDLPKTYCHEVMIEHPKFPKVKELNLKWAAVPAISNFVMRIGGIDYPCCPFNGWFLSTEIRRNLLERYNVAIPLARAMDVDLDDKMLTDIVGANLDTAILHSFEKNGFTIVDPMTVGKSFLTHCARERSVGRECPAQWSWIGGLVGPNNPTWHLEMRDFMKVPQYDYCCNPWEVIRSDANFELKQKNENDDSNEVSSVVIPNVIVAFGSETGTAEAAASSLARKLKLCKTTVLSLNELVSSDLLSKDMEGQNYLFVICSTFGQGVLPNNAKSFLDKELEKDMCSQFKYAVLALGSSLYPDFCKAGKDVDEKLKASGASELIKITTADAAQDGDVTISKWIAQVEKTILPSPLVEQLSLLSSKDDGGLNEVCYMMKWQDGNVGKSVPSSSLKEESGLMLCKQNSELFVDGNIKSRSTRHIELELPEGATYESGDHLMVKPLNNIETVRRLCKCFSYELTNAAFLCGYDKLDENLGSKTSPLEFQMNVPFSILSFPSKKELQDKQSPGTLFRSSNLIGRSLVEVLGRFLDLSFVHTSYVVDLLTMLLNKSKAIARDDKMASNFVQIAENIINAYNKGNTKSIEKMIAKFPTIVEFLEEFNTLFCVSRENSEEPLLSVADILVLMPSLQPRYYSISSASEVTPRSVILTVGVVNEKTALGRLVEGVCSHYLANLCPGDHVQATVVTSSFRLPVGKHHPLVFIGAGTGLAPIMGFLRERSHQFDKYKSSRFGECHLFFGCRDEDEYLYKDQLLQWEKRGIVKLHIAFSRSKLKSKQYVQDALTTYGSKLVEVLLSQDETFVYICGAAHIANECSDKCIELIAKHANMSRINAIHYMMKLRVERRWELDVWGDVKSLHSVQEEHTKNLIRASLTASALDKSFKWETDNLTSK